MNIKPYVYIIVMILALTSCNPEVQREAVPEETELSSDDPSKGNFLLRNNGDTLFTGISVPAIGKRIDPDSVGKPAPETHSDWFLK